MYAPWDYEWIKGALTNQPRWLRLPTNHMEIHTNSFLHSLNCFAFELDSFSSSFAMPRGEWKRKRQEKSGSRRGSKQFSGPLKEVPKSSTEPVEKTVRKTSLISIGRPFMLMWTLSLNQSARGRSWNTRGNRVCSCWHHNRTIARIPSDKAHCRVSATLPPRMSYFIYGKYSHQVLLLPQVTKCVINL